jgi:hypothetical protein
MMTVPCRHRTIARPAGLALAVLLPLVGTGCGPQAGAWLYNLGLAPKQTSTAEYEIPPGPVLILVDDDQDLIQPPIARQALIDALAKELKVHNKVEQVTTNEELARVQQIEPNFNDRGAREVGRLVGARTVLWISVQQFVVERDLELAVSPAQFAARIKLINAEAETRDQVRLWPPDREGYFLSVTVPPQEVRTCRSLKEVHEKVAEKAADQIAKLFRDYEIEPP